MSGQTGSESGKYTSLHRVSVDRCCHCHVLILTKEGEPIESDREDEANQEHAEGRIELRHVGSCGGFAHVDGAKISLEVKGSARRGQGASGVWTSTATCSNIKYARIKG